MLPMTAVTLAARPAVTSSFLHYINSASGAIFEYCLFCSSVTGSVTNIRFILSPTFPLKRIPLGVFPAFGGIIPYRRCTLCARVTAVNEKAPRRSCRGALP